MVKTSLLLLRQVIDFILNISFYIVIFQLQFDCAILVIAGDVLRKSSRRHCYATAEIGKI